MTTLAVFNRAEKENRAFKRQILKERGYRFDCSDNGRIAKKLHYLDKDGRGRMCEFIVGQEFREMGYKVEMLNGYGRHDTNLIIGDKRYRVEVKSSLVFHTKRNTFNAYCMPSIKPQHFDILVFVFISCKGLTYKIINQTGFMKHFAKRYSYSKDGYSIPFSMDCRNKYEYRKRYVLDLNHENLMSLCL